MRRAGIIPALAITVFVATSMTATAEPGGTRNAIFHLVGSATFATDPENPTDEVVQVDNTNDFGGTYRTLPKGTKVPQIDNQVGLFYYFVAPKTCAVGSPRIQLAVDTDGNGTSNGNAFGYLGDKPFGGACPMNTWTHEDMTNDVAKWDLTQFGGSYTNTWNDMETFFAAYPNHQVISGALIEDPTYAGGPPGGVTYYDEITIGNRTLSTHADASTS